jgi:hypothetical protein
LDDDFRPDGQPKRSKKHRDPDLSNTPWTADEDRLLEHNVKEFATRSNKIAAFFANRSDNRRQMIERRLEPTQPFRSVFDHHLVKFTIGQMTKTIWTTYSVPVDWTSVEAWIGGHR